MANDKKKMVEAITAQEVDFAQWYTDICTKAELVEYSSVKGFVVLRPYGYAIWENIQKNLDARFKATGHENVAMPVLIPESLLKKEGELVNGFAPISAMCCTPTATCPCCTTSGAASSAGRNPPARSCAPVSSGGRRVTPSTRPPRRPRPRPSSS